MRSTCVILTTLLVACSGGAGGGGDDDGDDDDGPDASSPADAPALDATPVANPGFVVPTASTKANVVSGNTWSEVGDADWSCLNTPSTDAASTGPIALSGRVTDLQNGNGVGDVTVTAWSASPSMTVGTATTSAVPSTRGAFSISLGVLPAGTRRYGFTLAAAGGRTTRVLGRYYAPGAPATDDLVIIGEQMVAAFSFYAGTQQDQTKALHFGTMLDCQGRRVSNAVAAVSRVPWEFHDTGGVTHYFTGASTSLPAPHDVERVMNNDGLFLVFNATPSETSYVQVWGFRTQAELSSGTLSLLGEIAAPSVAGGASMITLHPRRI